MSAEEARQKMIRRLRENAARPLPAIRQDALLVNRRPWLLQIGPHVLPPETPTEVAAEWVQTPGVAHLQRIVVKVP
jgi:hypothetical protein